VASVGSTILLPPRASRVLRHVDAIGFDERLSGLQTHRLEERARHGAADEQLIDLGQQLLDDVDLPRDLGAPSTATNGRFGFSSARPRYSSLLLHEQSGHGGLRHAATPSVRRVRPMRRAERVVHVQVAELASARDKRSSFVSSPPRKRVFSRSKHLPLGRASPSSPRRCRCSR
jgi:hypothetical protein